jgi:hypothetical protein
MKNVDSIFIHFSERGQKNNTRKLEEKIFHLNETRKLSN